MNTLLPSLVGIALVLALVIPPLSFLLYSFHRWRRASSPLQGVAFRAFTFLAALGLIFNTAFISDLLVTGGGIHLELSLPLVIACLISWVALWGRRGVNVVRRHRRTVQA